jgi:hypothetical protein
VAEGRDHQAARFVDDAADCRCPSCEAICCECPRGYFVTDMRCDCCRYEFVLRGPCCAPMPGDDTFPGCPECGGTLDLAEE